MSETKLQDLSIEQLEEKLVELSTKKFNLTMQQASGNESFKPHMLKPLRREIAKINTLLTQMKGNSRQQRMTKDEVQTNNAEG